MNQNLNSLTEEKIVKMKLIRVLRVILLLLYHSAFGVGSDEVSVMDGDSVTLYTGVQTNLQEKIKWYFNATLIAQINGDLSKICTDVQCNEAAERFRDRLKLDHQTGSLTITNTRNTDSGVYELKIFNPDTEKIFSVTVQDVPGSGLSSGVVAGIVVAVVLLVFAGVSAAVVYYRHRMSHAPVPQSNDDL